MRNIEIKARVMNLEALEHRARAIACKGPIPLVQDDTFFVCAEGRLKLRVCGDGSGELIFYRRANQRGPKESFYVTTRTMEPDSLRETLTLACGLQGRVKKHRTLYLIGRVRLHLDTVENLGKFLELEVVLDDHEPAQAGKQEAHRLMAALGVDPAQLVEGAYMDLLINRRESSVHSS